MPPKRNRQQRIEENKPTRTTQRQLQRQAKEQEFKRDVQYLKRLREQAWIMQRQVNSMKYLVRYKQMALDQTVLQNKITRQNQCMTIAKIVASELLPQYPNHDLPIVPPPPRALINHSSQRAVIPPVQPAVVRPSLPSVILPIEPSIISPVNSIGNPSTQPSISQ